MVVQQENANIHGANANVNLGVGGYRWCRAQSIAISVNPDLTNDPVTVGNGQSDPMIDSPTCL